MPSLDFFALMILHGGRSQRRIKDHFFEARIAGMVELCSVAVWVLEKMLDFGKESYLWRF